MTAHKHAAILAQAAEDAKPAKPRECWAGWSKGAADDDCDPWGAAWERRQHAGHLHMIEVTPEVRAALAAAGIEVSP